MSDKLHKLRDAIDHIDAKILQLIAKRMTLSDEVIAAKNGEAAFRPGREAALVRRLAAMDSDMAPAVLLGIWRQIMAASLTRQNKDVTDMAKNGYKAGKHFLQIPGPSNVPDRILRAMDYPTIDHRGPDFAKIGAECLAGIKTIFKTDSHVVIYPASGTGAWEAALVNVLQEGDLVLMVETGHFATLWHKMASRLGLETEFLATDWRRGADAQAIEDRLRKDSENKIKAVCVVHNETSTGSTSRIDEVRAAMNAAAVFHLHERLSGAAAMMLLGVAAC